MSSNKIISLILIVVGAGLVYWGYDMSGSLESKLSKTINGTNTNEVMMFYIAGAVCIAVGGYLFSKK